jgi:predicted  nucleic acid-binding Zn-ribbon protein
MRRKCINCGDAYRDHWHATIIAARCLCGCDNFEAAPRWWQVWRR